MDPDGRRKKPRKSALMRKIDFRWALRLVGVTFLISVLLSLFTSNALENAGFIVAFILLFAFILLGIAFDIAGVAITAASEKPFHSMAARKVRSARYALILIRNAEKVSSFCNDVVGDIAGIISGATCAVIVARMTTAFSLNESVTQLLFYGLVAALTIGGKALGKGLAINFSTGIVYFVARIIGVYFDTVRSVGKLFRREKD